MTARHSIVALAMVLTLGATVTGCSPAPRTSSLGAGTSGTSSASVQTSAAVGTVAAAAPGGTVALGGSASSDVKAFDQQLNAMQSELDKLNMPADSDFGQAETALY